MMIGGWERQGLVRFLALGSEGAFDPEAHPRFLSRMILCSFQGSIPVSGDDDFNKLPPPKRTLDLNMTGESKDQVYVRTFNAKEQLSAIDFFTNYFRHNEDFLTDDVCLPRGFGIGIRDPCNRVAVAP